MKYFRFILAIGSLAMVFPMTAAAQRGPAAELPPSLVGDPLINIYRAAGVRDDGGGANAGVATVFHCTNYSGGTETVRWTVRNFNNVLLSQMSLNIAVQETRTAATHDTLVFDEDLLLNTGNADQGLVSIHATSTNIVCSAQVVDASVASPQGWDLHLVRFNNMSGASGE